MITIPGLLVGAVLLVVLAVVWIPAALLADLLRGRWRLPLVRLLSFAVCWAWLETAGVVMSFVFLLMGKAGDEKRHYALQRWWAARLLGALRATCGVRVTAENVGCLRPGPVILFARHASLADSLVSAYVITSEAGMNPHYVLKIGRAHV